MSSVDVASRPQRTASLVWRGLTRSPSGFIGACIALAVMAFAFIGPLVIDSTNPSNGDKIWTGPSAEHWLGTNQQGKDTLIKLIMGGAEPLLVGFMAAFIAVGVAAVVGSLAGYLRGPVDTVALQITDIALTVPGIVLMLVITAMYRQISATTVGIIIGLTTWPVLMR